MNAALGVSQMDKIDNLISMRRALAHYYDKELSKISDICVPEVPEDYYHVYQMYTVRVEETKRNGLMKYLAKMGISSKIYFDPVHLTRFYRECFGHIPGELPVTERISREVLSLPIYPTLSTGEIDYIVRQIRQYFGVIHE
jgi:dTDP-4-amino-4,6-dideoxygalactose transaminase